MELDGGVSALDEPLGKLSVLVGRGETIRDLVAAHRGAVCGDFVSHAAEDLPDGHVDLASEPVP